MPRFKIYCETDAKWETKDDTAAPSTCPTDAGHTVKADSVAQVLKSTTVSHTGSYVPLINPDANGVTTVTQDATWQEVAVHDGNPEYYIPILASSLGRYTVKVKCDVTGGAPEIKIIERDADGANPVDITSTPIAVSDTAGAWSALQFSTNITPRSGLHEFCVAARLNGGTSLSIKGNIAIALLEVL